jgi:CubicO group peptidase (beta-lactamase class C family)
VDVGGIAIIVPRPGSANAAEAFAAQRRTRSYAFGMPRGVEWVLGLAIVGLVAALWLYFAPGRDSGRPVDPDRLADWSSQIAELDAAIPEILDAAHAPGLAIALIRDREVVWMRGYGVREVGATAPVGPDTVFEAGSMSKPVFAYAVLKLVEAGDLDLDRPLDGYLEAPYLPDQPGAAAITARMVLVHTSGLQDIRDDWESDGPLRLLYVPGTRFFYSGEGFYYLQQVVERIANRSLDEHMDETLLRHLAMSRSSFVWQERFASDLAAGHDRQGLVKPERRYYSRPNAAHTLYTTARDFSRFLVEMLELDRRAAHQLGAAGLETMVTVQRREEAASGQESPSLLRWASKSVRTLGWRYDPGSGFVHHAGAGHQGFRCFSRFHPQRGAGLVILTNGEGAGDAVRVPILRILDG